MKHYGSLKKALHKYVRIDWEDAVAFSGWGDGKQGLEECETYGFVSSVTPTSVTVSGTRSGQEYNQHITIPMACIVKVTISSVE